MPSAFTRMFRYAKAVGADAKENFTTEVLAGAIRSDPRPFLAALGASVTTCPLPTEAELTVTTQFAIQGAGIIDLVLDLHAPAATTRVWIEVKVDAGESGEQLANYRRYIDSLQSEHPQLLVVLGPRPLTEGVPWLSWQQLRDSIARSKTTSPYWSDFKLYLEDIRMADNFDEAVTGVEAQALLPARNLMFKLARILTPFAAEANQIWRGAGWPAGEQKVIDALLGVFERKGTFTIANNLSPNEGVSAGLYHEPATGDGWLGLWIWSNPRRVRERQAILQAANKLAESPEWHQDDAEWELFGAYRRLVELGSQSEGTAWLKMKLSELRDAGVLDALTT